jgi:hypothetical protein
MTTTGTVTVRTVPAIGTIRGIAALIVNVAPVLRAKAVITTPGCKIATACAAMSCEAPRAPTFAVKAAKDAPIATTPLPMPIMQRFFVENTLAGKLGCFDALVISTTWFVLAALGVF